MTHKINIHREFKEQLEIRYVLPHLSHLSGGNIVVDSFYPTILIDNSDINILSSTAIAISPVIARDLQVRNAHISDLCALLGYKIKDIKSILMKVKALKRRLNLLGAGGTGSNFVYFAEELCNWTNTINVFKSICISDNDSFSITNMPRIPFDFSSSKSILKSKNVASHIKSLTSDKKYKIRKTSNFDTKTIYYGAPDIETREAINISGNIQFVSATHGSDHCSLLSSPMQDTGLQVEAYGQIDLGIFFMNQLKMTIEFLRLVGEETDFSKTGELMQFSFRDMISGSMPMGKASRTYNFVAPLQEHIGHAEEAIVEDMQND